MRAVLPVLASLAILGCNRPLLDETSSGHRVRVDEGRVFTVSLPAARRPDPTIRGDAVSLRDFEHDPDSGRDFFTFKADRPGESEILIADDYRVLIQVWRPVVPLRRHIHLRRHVCRAR